MHTPLVSLWSWIVSTIHAVVIMAVLQTSFGIPQAHAANTSISLEPFNDWNGIVSDAAEEHGWFIVGNPFFSGAVAFSGFGEDIILPTEGDKHLEIALFGDMSGFSKEFEGIPGGSIVSFDWTIRFYDPPPYSNTVGMLANLVSPDGQPLTNVPLNFFFTKTADGNVNEWQHTSIPIPMDGNLIMDFFILYDSGTATNSPTILVVDNIRLETVSETTPVPVPGALILFGTSALLLPFMRRRRT